MPNRDGSTSSFPASADTFLIKRPYNSNLALDAQDPNSLEDASTFNKMFDAIVNMETYILGGSGGAGAGVVTRWSNGVVGSDTDVYGPNLKMGYSSINFTISGNTTIVTAMVPSSFGADPFHENGFSMATSLYITPPGGVTTTQGIWANAYYGEYGPFNNMLQGYQFFTLVRPLGGQQFETTVTNFPFRSDGLLPGGNPSDNMLFNGPGLYQPLNSRDGWAGLSYNYGVALENTSIDGYNILQLQSEDQAGSKAEMSWGFVYCDRVKPNLTNSYIEFGPIDRSAVGLQWMPDGWGAAHSVYSRFGPMIRATGTATSAYFYGLAIGDVDRTPFITSGSVYGSSEVGSRTARLVKVSNVQLNQPVDGTSHTWTYAGSAWSPGATITDIGGIQLTLIPYTNRYRLSAIGDLITVQTATTPFTSWTVVASAIDTAYASGAIGFFAKGMEDGANRRMIFQGSVDVADLTATPIDAQLQFVFVEIDPQANMLMETD